MILSRAEAQFSPTSLTRAEHLLGLRNLCQSDLEREWLDYLEAHHLNLPSHAQKLIEACHTRPDFLYENAHVAIYVDGYHHLFPERQVRDQAQQECMEDYGFTVVRFGLLDNWEELIQSFSTIFGFINKSF